VPTIAWIFIGIVVAWGLILAVILTVAVKSGKLQLKRGGAPGIDGGSRGSDSSLNL
jgi:hypothetical protein